MHRKGLIISTSNSNDMKKIISILLMTVSLFLTSSCSGRNESDRFFVHCFNAGAADCFIIKAEKSCVMIDTAEGSFGDEIVSYLKENGIEKLDCLIITHFDKDHVGGASKVLKNTGVDRILQSNYNKNDSKGYIKYEKAAKNAGITPETVRNTCTFSCGGAEFTVYPPNEDEYEKSPSNNSSLIVSVEYGDNRFLFCGDAEDARISEFLDENTGNYNFIKMPHHGRIGKKTATLISSVKPEFAVITSSNDEPESEQTMKLLNDAGVGTFLTRNGDVEVISDGKTVSVSYK